MILLIKTTTPHWVCQSTGNELGLPCLYPTPPTFVISSTMNLYESVHLPFAAMNAYQSGRSVIVYIAT